MKSIFLKYRFHVIICAGMLIYLLFAKDIYNHFFITIGRPILENSTLPAENDAIKFHIDLFEPSTFKGQTYYSMVGWAFSTLDPKKPPEDYKRLIVIISEKRNYSISVDSYSRPDIQKYYQSLGMELNESGFRSQVAPDFIKPGTYRIGMVFTDPKDGSSFIKITNKILIRTPNQLQISVSPPTP